MGFDSSLLPLPQQQQLWQRHTTPGGVVPAPACATVAGFHSSPRCTSPVCVCAGRRAQAATLSLCLSSSCRTTACPHLARRPAAAHGQAASFAPPSQSPCQSAGPLTAGLAPLTAPAPTSPPAAASKGRAPPVLPAAATGPGCAPPWPPPPPVSAPCPAICRWPAVVERQRRRRRR